MIFNIVINHLFEKVWYYKEFLMSSFLGRKEFTVLLYNDSNLLGEITHFSCSSVVSNLVLSWKRWPDSERSMVFQCFLPVSRTSWICITVSLKSLFSLSYSLFCRSSPIHLCLGKAQQIHTLKRLFSSHSCVLGMPREWLVMLWFHPRPLTFWWCQVYQVDAHQQVKLRFPIDQSLDHNHQYHPCDYAWMK